MHCIPEFCKSGFLDGSLMKSDMRKYLAFGDVLTQSHRQFVDPPWSHSAMVSCTKTLRISTSKSFISCAFKAVVDRGNNTLL